MRFFLPRGDNQQPREFPTQREGLPKISKDDYNCFANATLNRLFEALESPAEAKDDADVEFWVNPIFLFHLQPIE